MVVVGRGPEADLQLVHPLVSRRHAELTLQDDGDFLVRDLGSRNGTIVNDEVLQELARAVTAPAVVQVGPYVLRLTPASLIADETLQVQASLEDADSRRPWTAGCTCCRSMASR